MSVTDATAAPIVAIQRALPQPLMVMDDGHRGSEGPSEHSADAKFKFSDLVALVNPLQHLPVIGPLYRKLTGDEPHPAVKVVGGLLFGGPLGMMNATLSHILEQTTGKSVVDIVADLFTGDGDKPAVADAGATATALGVPRSLIPAATTSSPVAATATPTQGAAAAATSASNTAAPLAARQAGARDLAWYQLNAGARMPATINGSTATGSQGPSVPRSVGPSHVQGSMPTAQASAASSALATAPISAAEFLNRATIAQQRYTALMQQAARSSAAIDRFE